MEAEPGGKRPGIVDEIPGLIRRYWAFTVCCDVSQFPDCMEQPENPPVQQTLLLQQLQAIELRLIAAQCEAMVLEKMADHGLREAAQTDRREVGELFGVLLCFHRKDMKIRPQGV